MIRLNVTVYVFIDKLKIAGIHILFKTTPTPNHRRQTKNSLYGIWTKTMLISFFFSLFLFCLLSIISSLQGHHLAFTKKNQTNKHFTCSFWLAFLLYCKQIYFFKNSKNCFSCFVFCNEIHVYSF